MEECSGHDDADSDTGDSNNNKSIDNVEDRDNGNANKPEPEKNKDLFINDVEGKNTKAIVDCHSARGSILIEGAFGNLDTIKQEVTNKCDFYAFQYLCRPCFRIHTFGKTTFIGLSLLSGSPIIMVSTSKP